jgi:aerobic-type carbon monoxide dehydrogenase small subunit (CoxS/CutS family)
MMDKALVSLHINGTACEAKAALYDTLLTVLRDQLFFTSAKRGCNQGVCGACTVLVDGASVRSCLSLALNCEDSRIETLEGLCDDRLMRMLQNAFIKRGAFQCAFCTPGMLISAYTLLRDNQSVTASNVRNALSGNLCRCTGYKKIVEAVLDVAHALREGGGQ